VAARISAPSLGAASYQPAGTWTGAISYRWQRSDRHFVGDEEQEEREAEGSQVINNISVLDLSVGYAISKRVTATLSIPFQFATRSQVVRSNDAARTILTRFQTEAIGLSDMKLLGTSWLLDPEQNKKQNISVGLGVKFPTGEKDARDTFQVYDPTTKQIIAQERNVDQSIQPGDGAWGIIFDVYMFKEVIPNLNLFAAATYIAEPEEDAGVLNGLGPTKMSTADSYLFRAGAGWTFLPKQGLTLTLSARMEGTPVEDIFGESGGFRRPGFAISIEPGLVYSKNRWTASLSAPVALYRNRERSVIDEQTGRHGDAAFADFMILVSVGRSF
jgi:hypothetical protein